MFTCAQALFSDNPDEQYSKQNAALETKAAQMGNPNNYERKPNAPNKTGETTKPFKKPPLPHGSG